MRAWRAAVLVPILGRRLLDEHPARRGRALSQRGHRRPGTGRHRRGEAARRIGGNGTPSFTIRVARGDAGRAVDLLGARGLPRPATRGFAQTYGQPSLIPTASEERARYLDALAGEIERTLESADGVVSARVHLALEEAEPLALDDKPRNPARAAVLLKARAGRSPLDEDDVRKLVAGSVAGLAPSAVSVVMTPAPETTEAASLTAVGPLRVTPGTRSPPARFPGGRVGAAGAAGRAPLRHRAPTLRPRGEASEAPKSIP